MRYVWVFNTSRPESLACGVCGVAQAHHTTEQEKSVKQLPERGWFGEHHSCHRHGLPVREWMRDCAILSSLPREALTSVHMCLPTSPSVSMFFFWLFRNWLGGFQQRETVPRSGQGILWVRLNCSCSARIVHVGDSVATPMCFSFCLRVLILGIFRLVLHGRDVVPYFTVSSYSVFESKNFSVSWVQVQSFGDGAALPSLFGVSACDTLL